MQLSLDIFAVTAIIYASGGFNNGLGVLLAVSVGVSSLLIGNRKALAVPAAATLALFTQAIFANITTGLTIPWAATAFLGASFFIISFLSLTLAKRLHYSEMSALESRADLASMQAVNQDIIQTLNSGVIVVDDKLTVQIINDTAWRNLGMPSQPVSQPLKSVCREIYLATKQWLANPISSAVLVPIQRINIEYQLSFRKLGEDEHNLILIFLEDTSKLTQQAQQLKLSSLGRLTASIAHEIRNPLGAISHAAQLLNESEDINKADKDLCQVIVRHSKRMNSIIENVLNLSQHRPPQQEDIVLNDLVNQIKLDLTEHYQPTPEIIVNLEPEAIHVSFDRSQLTQIINNLCENGLRYSLEQTGTATIQIAGGQEYPSAKAFMDIIDNGPGIEEDLQDKIFEPFFTTSQQGTGLGLYLARELCESNGARLNYLPVPSGEGTCFRIQFS
jgi:two-component system sensor histidine kinase PilS (NtrC family)